MYKIFFQNCEFKRHWGVVKLHKTGAKFRTNLSISLKFQWEEDKESRVVAYGGFVSISEESS
jgi:dihydroneopterin aldolase